MCTFKLFSGLKPSRLLVRIPDSGLLSYFFRFFNENVEYRCCSTDLKDYQAERETWQKTGWRCKCVAVDISVKISPLKVLTSFAKDKKKVYRDDKNTVLRWTKFMYLEVKCLVTLICHCLFGISGVEVTLAASLCPSVVDKMLWKGLQFFFFFFFIGLVCQKGCSRDQSW